MPTGDPVSSGRDGAIIFGDLIGKLDVLYVHCEKWGAMAYLDRLIEERGRDAKLIDWLDEITADCPKRRQNSCGSLVLRCERRREHCRWVRLLPCA